MLKKELRGRKVKITRSMDVEERFYTFRTRQAHLCQRSVDRKDLAPERTHTLGHHFTPTGPTGGHNNESDCAMEDNVFLARSSDAVYPKHLSLDERVAFEIADSAEWKAIVDSGSVKVLDSEVCQHDKEGATRQGDQRSNGETTQASGGHFPETESQVQMVCFWDTRILTLPTCSPTHPLHRQRAS